MIYEVQSDMKRSREMNKGEQHENSAESEMQKMRKKQEQQDETEDNNSGQEKKNNDRQSRNK